MIRKVYTDLILRKLREDGPSWLLRRCRQYLLLQFSSPLCGPTLGTLWARLKTLGSFGEFRRLFGGAIGILTSSGGKESGEHH